MRKTTNTTVHHTSGGVHVLHAFVPSRNDVFGSSVCIARTRSIQIPTVSYSNKVEHLRLFHRHFLSNVSHELVLHAVDSTFSCGEAPRSLSFRVK